MTERRMEGRVVFAGTNTGIKDLEVVAFDLDFFL